MKLEVNFEKRYFVFLLIGILVIGGIVTVYAYNSGLAPSVFGHSAEELEINYDFKVVQKRVGDCPADTAIQSIQQDGDPNCINVRDSLTGGGTVGGCDRIANLDTITTPSVTQIAIDVPADCIGNVCDLLFVSKPNDPDSSRVSYVEFIKFSQDVPGLGSNVRNKQWFTDKGNSGFNDGGAAEFISQIIKPDTGFGGSYTVAALWDDHGSFSGASNSGKIVVTTRDDHLTRLYICS